MRQMHRSALALPRNSILQPTFKLSNAAIGAGELCLTLSARAATPATTPDPAAQGAFSAESTLNAGTRGGDISLNAAIVKLALLLAPAMALGLWAGRRITLRLSREQFLRMVNAVVLCSGGALVLHYLLRLD